MQRSATWLSSLLSEIFDIGRDTSTQVDPDYEGGPLVFTGSIDRVIITLRD